MKTSLDLLQKIAVSGIVSIGICALLIHYQASRGYDYKVEGVAPEMLHGWLIFGELGDHACPADTLNENCTVRTRDSLTARHSPDNLVPGKNTNENECKEVAKGVRLVSFDWENHPPLPGTSLKRMVHNVQFVAAEGPRCVLRLE